MAAYRWKKYCIKCHYQLEDSNAGACPECGQPFDPSDDATWSKRAYNLDKLLSRRRWVVAVLALAILLIGGVLAILFPASALLILIVAALPIVGITAAWGVGVDVVELTRLIKPIKMPVKVEVDEEPFKLDPLIGKVGQVTVTLKPVGRVNIEGKAYEAKSELSLIEIGERVKVVGTNEWMLIVRGEHD